MRLPFKMISQSQYLGRLGELLKSFHEMFCICKEVRATLDFLVKNEFFSKRRYGAQNEAYMSRSAEKWVRGLCFNELGVCG